MGTITDNYYWDAPVKRVLHDGNKGNIKQNRFCKGAKVIMILNKNVTISDIDYKKR